MRKQRDFRCPGLKLASLGFRTQGCSKPRMRSGQTTAFRSDTEPLTPSCCSHLALGTQAKRPFQTHSLSELRPLGPQPLAPCSLWPPDPLGFCLAPTSLWPFIWPGALPSLEDYLSCLLEEGPDLCLDQADVELRPDIPHLLGDLG